MDRRLEMRRTMTLSEQLSKPDLAIRDFLKIPHDDGDTDRRPSTLMDAIGRDGCPGEGRPTAGGAGNGGLINWKPLRDRLRLRRAASAWTWPAPSPKPAAANSGAGALSDSKSGSDRNSKYNYSPCEAAAAFSRTYSRAPSLRATPTISRAASTRVGPASELTSTGRAVADDEEEEEDDDDEDDGEEESKDEAPAAQISLMALLDQTDSQWDEDEDEEEDEDAGGGGGAATRGAPKSAAGDDDDVEDDGEGPEEEMVHVCCVCMVRHKGAAFIPCGHTFCRLCSRELWVSRGNCPLCNGFIQEILDIF